MFLCIFIIKMKITVAVPAADWFTVKSFVSFSVDVDVATNSI